MEGWQRVKGGRGWKDGREFKSGRGWKDGRG